MKVSISQPSYLPWLGFFDKIARSDVFIIYDTAQYVKQGEAFHSRNKIRTKDGWQWLVVPVKSRLGDKIKDVKIDNSKNWADNHWKSICQNYTKAEFFNKYKKDFENIYQSKWETLADLNIEIIRKIIDILGIKTEIRIASELGGGDLRATDALVFLCQHVKANEYLSGKFGKEYLEVAKFEKAGIKVEFQEFHHPVYKQVYGGFEPSMSITDLIFNCGNKSLDILLGKE